MEETEDLQILSPKSAGSAFSETSIDKFRRHGRHLSVESIHSQNSTGSIGSHQRRKPRGRGGLGSKICNFCGDQFEKGDVLREHMNQVHPELLRKCESDDPILLVDGEKKLQPILDPEDSSSRGSGSYSSGSHGSLVPRVATEQANVNVNVVGFRQLQQRKRILQFQEEETQEGVAARLEEPFRLYRSMVSGHHLPMTSPLDSNVCAVACLRAAEFLLHQLVVDDDSSNNNNHNNSSSSSSKGTLRIDQDTVDQIMVSSDRYCRKQAYAKEQDVIFDPLLAKSFDSFQLEMIPLRQNEEYMLEEVNENEPGTIRKVLLTLSNVCTNGNNNGACGLINCGLDTVLVYMSGDQCVLFDPANRSQGRAFRGFAHETAAFIQFNESEDMATVLESIFFPVCHTIQEEINKFIEVAESNLLRFFIFKDKKRIVINQGMLPSRSETTMALSEACLLSRATHQLSLNESEFVKWGSIYSSDEVLKGSLAESFAASLWCIPPVRAHVLGARFRDAPSSLEGSLRAIFFAVEQALQSTTISFAYQSLSRALYSGSPFAFFQNDMGMLFDSILRDMVVRQVGLNSRTIAGYHHNRRHRVTDTCLADVFSYTSSMRNMETGETRILEHFVHHVPGFRFLSLCSGGTHVGGGGDDDEKNKQQVLSMILKDLLVSSLNRTETFASRNSLLPFLPRTRPKVEENVDLSLDVVQTACDIAQEAWRLRMPPCDVFGVENGEMSSRAGFLKEPEPPSCRPVYFMLRSKGPLPLRSGQTRTVFLTASERSVDSLVRGVVAPGAANNLLPSDLECFLDDKCMQEYILCWIGVAIMARNGDPFYTAELARLSPAMLSQLAIFEKTLSSRLQRETPRQWRCSRALKRYPARYCQDDSNHVSGTMKTDLLNEQLLPIRKMDSSGLSVVDLLLDHIHIDQCPFCTEEDLSLSNVMYNEEMGLIVRNEESNRFEKEYFHSELKVLGKQCCLLLRTQKFEMIQHRILKETADPTMKGANNLAIDPNSPLTSHDLHKLPYILPICFDWSRDGKRKSALLKDLSPIPKNPSATEIKRCLESINQIIDLLQVYKKPASKGLSKGTGTSALGTSSSSSFAAVQISTNNPFPGTQGGRRNSTQTLTQLTDLLGPADERAGPSSHSTNHIGGTSYNGNTGIHHNQQEQHPKAYETNSFRFWRMTLELLKLADSPSLLYEALRKTATLLTSNSSFLPVAPGGLLKEIERELADAMDLFSEDADWNPILKKAADLFLTQIRLHNKLVAGGGSAFELFCMVTMDPPPSHVEEDQQQNQSEDEMPNFGTTTTANEDGDDDDDDGRKYLFNNMQRFCVYSRRFHRGKLSKHWFKMGGVEDSEELSWDQMVSQMTFERRVPVLCFYHKTCLEKGESILSSRRDHHLGGSSSLRRQLDEIEQLEMQVTRLIASSTSSDGTAGFANHKPEKLETTPSQQHDEKDKKEDDCVVM